MIDPAHIHPILATDPISLLGLGIGLLGGGISKLFGSHSTGGGPSPAPGSTPTSPAAPQSPAIAPPTQSPTGSSASLKTGPGAGTPSFLASAAAPQQQSVSGTKSLLGQ